MNTNKNEEVENLVDLDFDPVVDRTRDFGNGVIQAGKGFIDNEDLQWDSLAHKIFQTM